MTESEIREEFNDREFVDWILARPLYFDQEWLSRSEIHDVHTFLIFLALTFNAGRQAEK
jgi:hypothetical protein